MGNKTNIHSDYKGRHLGRMIDQAILPAFISKGKLQRNSEMFSESEKNPTFVGTDWVKVARAKPELFATEISKRLPVNLRRKCKAKIEIVGKSIEISFVPKKSDSRDSKSGIGKTTGLS